MNKSQSLKALNQIQILNNPQEEAVKQALIRELNNAEFDSPDILLSLIEETFNIKDLAGMEGFEHITTNPNYQDGIDFLTKYIPDAF